MRGIDEAEALRIAATRPGSERTRAIVGLLASRLDDDPEQVPLGRRDEALVALRIATFGSLLTSVADCAGCGTLIEAELDLAWVQGLGGAELTEFAVDAGGATWHVRVPNTIDVLEAGRTGDPARSLVARCAIDAVGRVIDADVVEAISAGLAEAVPIVDIAVQLACVECGEPTTRTLDIVSVLSRELDTHSQRVIHDVVVLARAFGWSESEVLAVPPSRRHRYLEMAGP